MAHWLAAGFLSHSFNHIRTNLAIFVADGSTIPLRLLCASKMASSSLSVSPEPVTGSGALVVSGSTGALVVSGSTGALVVSGLGASVTTEVGSDATE